MMPLMDGFGFLDEFEKLPEYLIQRMKIIILTSSLNEDDFSRAKKYKSVINIIKKPLLLNKMLEIKEELEKYQVNN
jgi:CheY-like chemotaxis protein